jgi:hypothetical protein
MWQQLRVLAGLTFTEDDIIATYKNLTDRHSIHVQLALLYAVVPERSDYVDKKETEKQNYF